MAVFAAFLAISNARTVFHHPARDVADMVRTMHGAEFVLVIEYAVVQGGGLEKPTPCALNPRQIAKLRLWTSRADGGTDV